MGNVQVQYKQRRGANEAGTEITNPLEYLRELLDSDFDATKALYDGLSEEHQTQFKSFFEGDDIMESKAGAEMWLNTNEEDEETIGAAYNGVKGLIAQLQAAGQ